MLGQAVQHRVSASILPMLPGRADSGKALQFAALRFTDAWNHQEMARASPASSVSAFLPA